MRGSHAPVLFLGVYRMICIDQGCSNVRLIHYAFPIPTSHVGINEELCLTINPS